MASRKRVTPIECRPATAERWGDLETLFGKNGACAGCWCMWWRLPHSRWLAQKGDLNRADLRQIVSAGRPVGLLAYAGAKPVGWCAVAPRAEYPRLATSRILKPVDDQPVWSITCFFVARSSRRQGVSRALIEAAAHFAFENGARIVEAYPVSPKTPQADAFVYTGLAAAFRRTGFKEVARRSPTRPIMRRARA